MAKSVEDYLDSAGPWREPLSRLREVLLGCGLEETVKWGAPCYMAHGQNIVGLAAFKQHFGLWFFQGALLEDDDGVLTNAQQGRTRAMRQWRMTAAKDVQVRAVRRYVKAAIALAAAGKRVPPRRNRPLDVPAELARALDSDAVARKAFEALRPGQQREYADHVASAKRAATRERRAANALPLICAGQGLNDRYRR